MKIAIASDHGGLNHKTAIINYLKNKGHQVIDCGTSTFDSCHYPVFAKRACNALINKEAERVILICTSGEGMSMMANRYKGIRCGIAYNDEVTRLMREHNNANAISFGEKFMEIEDVLNRVEIFLTTPFSGGRHLIRTEMLDNE